MGVILLFLAVFYTSIAAAGWNYTTLDAAQYRQIVAQSRSRVQQLLQTLQPYRHHLLDTQVALIGSELADLPYIYLGGVGEGDWQPTSHTYKPGAVHVAQNPVYRFDGFDCQSFVEVVMALLKANTLDEFDSRIVEVSYGAAGNPNGELVRYYNRNNFVDGDFNPINQRQGLLLDVTSHGELAPYASETSAILTRQRWFTFQQHNMRAHVRVLDSENGSAMAKRFRTVYSALPYPRFDSEQVAISYVPKKLLALRQRDGSYLPNQALLDKISTPAIAEVVRDIKVWGRGRARDLLGSELSVSHFGVLYRHTFKAGDLIYQKITCDFNDNYTKTCQVQPVRCEQSQCKELMFVHATDAYPMGFYWYQQADGDYTCTRKPPAPGMKFSQCNRVERIPFYQYISDYQFRFYWYLTEPSILGYHFEKLL
jgi:hypothetical protein